MRPYRLEISPDRWRAFMTSVTVRNMPGRGCVFVLEVPLALQDALAPQATV
jgi:hypothetical protein